MFTWICPQCGAEVPPSHSECPQCAERAAEQSAQPTVPQAAPPAPPRHPPPPPPAQPVYGQQPPQYPPYAGQPVPQHGPQHAAYPPQYPYPYPKPGPPGWLVTLGVAAVVSLIGGGFYYYVSTKNAGSGATPAVELESPAPAESTGAAAGTAKGGPAKFLEASGIRLFEEDKRARVRLMLVNHASADFADLSGNVILMSTDGKEIGSLPFVLPQLRAYDSRELEGPIKTSMRAYEMPDWQFVRAEVRLKE